MQYELEIYRISSDFKGNLNFKKNQLSFENISFLQLFTSKLMDGKKFWEFI